ncbi:hypothetical protein HRbin04_00763 [archaeon HR04]|nr:hypothetical protein HRbin04_00763 [archaeon HR04]
MTDSDPNKVGSSSSLLLLLIPAGAASGIASALYLYFNREPLMVQLTIHVLMLSSGYILLSLYKRVNYKSIAVYLVSALPMHLLIHILLIRDITITP